MAGPPDSCRIWPTPTASSSRAPTWPRRTRSGFQWVVEAKSARREGHPHRPAVHPDQRARAHVRADARRRGHRVPRRRDQLHPEQREGLPRVRPGVHERVDDRQRGLPGHRGPGRAVLRLRPGDQRVRPDAAGQYAGQEDEGQSHGERTADRETASGLRARVARAAGGRRRAARRDAAAPALRLPDPQAALRPLHPGGGASRSAACRRSKFLEVCRGLDRATPAGSGPPRWSTRSAGPSTASGVQYIRTGAIIQLLLGNMGRPGGGVMALRGHASIQGSHRHPDAVQPAARLPADAAPRAARDVPAVDRRDPAPGPEGLLGATPRRTRSACSRRTSATTPPPRTTGDSASCPG